MKIIIPYKTHEELLRLLQEIDDAECRCKLSKPSRRRQRRHKRGAKR